jgi:hypothetical protein
MAVDVGSVVKVRHEEGFRYVLHVQVVRLTDSGFVGRVQAVFAEQSGQVTGGDILRLVGTEKEFGNSEIVR